MEARTATERNWRDDSDFELGKEEILSYWRRILRCYGLDERRLSYKWESAPARGTWALSTSTGGARFDLAFVAEDVRDWAEKPRLVGKYLPAIQDVLDQILDQDPEMIR